MSSYGVVATVVAPTLKGVRQSDLIKFEIEYDAYKERVADVNRSRDASRRIQPASIRHCIDASLLHSLCILGQIDSATQLSEATDVNVKKWFEDRLQTSPEDLTERVRSALDSVQYSVDRKDPSGAALAFVVNVVTALDKNNASEVVKDTDTCKSLIAKMIEKLEPPELRQRIVQSRDYWNSEQRASLQYFQSRVSAAAVEVLSRRNCSWTFTEGQK